MSNSSFAVDSAMRRALRLAALGRGRVEPNPCVGAVLLRGGRVMGEGWHTVFGRSHAEVEAIADARRRARGGMMESMRGATLVVTLEPCCMSGKTPPCTEAVLEAGIGTVVCAMVDPDPRVAGRGVAALREAGVAVRVGVREAEARRLNGPFVKRVTTGLPWVMGKWAQSIDGRIAAATGDSRWISGEPARRSVHRVRGEVDAIVVGVGAALADDPALTARDVPVLRVARRVVVDPLFRLPLDSQLARTARERPVLVAGAEAEGSDAAASARRTALERLGVETTSLPWRAAGELAIEPLLRGLAERGGSRVVVEGGGGLMGSMLRQGLLDELRVYVSGRLLGDGGAPAVRGVAPPRVADAVGFTLWRSRRLGEDVELVYLRPATA